MKTGPLRVLRFVFFRRRAILRLPLRRFWRVLFFTRNVPPWCSCELLNTLIYARERAFRGTFLRKGAESSPIQGLGRRNNVRRQRRHRERQRNCVTHQGSPIQGSTAKEELCSTVKEQSPHETRVSTGPHKPAPAHAAQDGALDLRCTFCERYSSPFLRTDFLPSIKSRRRSSSS